MRSIIAAAAGLVAVSASSPPCHIYQYDSIESPCFVSVKNTTNYEIRTYGSANLEFWATSTTGIADWGTAVQAGFGDNFEYISGQNSAAQKIPMTTPVMSRNSTSGWQISFYVPASIFGNNASAIPTSSSVSIAAIPETGATFAVYEFPGYATEEQFAQYDAQVRTALAADGVETVMDTWASCWMQYDSPFNVFNRHNEVWVHIAQ